MEIETRDPTLKRAQRAARNLRKMRPENYKQAALSAAANLLDALVLRVISDEHTFNHVARKRDEADADLAAARASALREALEAVTAEHLVEPMDEEDAAYDRAIRDARQAIGRLFHSQSARAPRRGDGPCELAQASEPSKL